MFNYSVILTNVGSCCDRFLPAGYGKHYNNAELFERVNQIKAIKGVELIGGTNITKSNVSEIKDYLHKYGLEVTSIIPDHFGESKWGKGAFLSPDKGIREAAVQETCDMMDIAAEIGCKIINIWNGQDGHDYPFQINYSQAYDWLVEGITKCADYRKDIKISLEYKPKEPRTHSAISNIFSALSYINDIDRENVGLTIDTGHSLEAYENMAEAASIAIKKNKLFHMHFNDNYRLWDDDMIVGSIHTIEYIELLYWLKKGDYTGWLSIDQYPYREDSVQAVNQSIKLLMAFEKALKRIDEKDLSDAFNRHDAVASSEIMRKLLFG